MSHNRQLLKNLATASKHLEKAEKLLANSFGPIHPIRAQLAEYIKKVTAAVDEDEVIARLER